MSTKKNYAVKDTVRKEVHYRDIVVPTNEFEMNGISTIELWGGGLGYIQMDSTTFKADKLTKAVMFANLNDGQFGCQKIKSAKVSVEQKFVTTRLYADEDGNFSDDNVSTEIIHWENIVVDLYVSEKDFDETVGDPLRVVGRGGYEYKEKTENE